MSEPQKPKGYYLCKSCTIGSSSTKGNSACRYCGDKTQMFWVCLYGECALPPTMVPAKRRANHYYDKHDSERFGRGRRSLQFKTSRAATNRGAGYRRIEPATSPNVGLSDQHAPGANYVGPQTPAITFVTDRSRVSAAVHDLPTSLQPTTLRVAQAPQHNSESSAGRPSVMPLALHPQHLQLGLGSVREEQPVVLQYTPVENLDANLFIRGIQDHSNDGSSANTMAQETNAGAKAAPSLSQGAPLGEATDSMQALEAFETTTLSSTDWDKALEAFETGHWELQETPSSSGTQPREVPFTASQDNSDGKGAIQVKDLSPYIDADDGLYYHPSE